MGGRRNISGDIVKVPWAYKGCDCEKQKLIKNAVRYESNQVACVIERSSGVGKLMLVS